MHDNINDCDFNRHISDEEMLHFINIDSIDNSDDVMMLGYVNAHLMKCDECRRRIEALKDKPNNL